MVSEDRMSESHQRLEWDEFFDHLHEGDHAVIYHGQGVDEDRGTLHVDVHPGLAERIQSALGWGSTDEEDYTLRTEQIRSITDDEVELRSEEHLPVDER